MSNEESYCVGFAFGEVAMLFLMTVRLVGCESVRNKDSEILRIEYKNINNGASREMIEDMVKTQFPSSKWENVEYDCSKNWVNVKFSNP